MTEMEDAFSAPIYKYSNIFQFIFYVYLQVISNLHTHYCFIWGVMYFGLWGESRRNWEGMEWIWIIWLHWNHLDKYFTFYLNILLKKGIDYKSNWNYFISTRWLRKNLFKTLQVLRGFFTLRPSDLITILT